MNSNYGKSSTSFDFDLGIGSSHRSTKSLNDQKNKPNNSYSYMSSSSTSSFSQPKPASTTPSWQPGKPSWTHQPGPSNTGLARSELGGPPSMVGDILGKSWNSTKPATGQQSGGANIGIVVNKNPNLFGDLVSSALGQNKSSSNAPLKSAPPVKGTFSVGNISDSLPKTTATSYNNSGTGNNVGVSGFGGVTNNSNNNKSSNITNKSGNGNNVGLGGSQSFGSFGGVTNNFNNNSGGGSGYGVNGMGKSASVGGNSMRNLGGGGGGGGVGVGMKSNKDPFGSLVDFSSKPISGGGGGVGVGGSLNSSSNATGSVSSEDFGFGDFQNALKSNASAFPSGNTNADSWGSNLGSVPKMDGFATKNSNPAPVQSSGGDSFDMFFTSTTNDSGSGGAAAPDGAVGGHQFSGLDDWGTDSEFGGGEHDGGGSTIEIKGLPPPPAGVSASIAKAKGLDNYKQGQFADAIKWLSWAEILLEKAGETAGSMEVLTCRASCYKEVGEYKKAVADCTKVLDRDGVNVSVLVQRALLYESMEKYRLGADDLRTVMKIDPANRVARSTIHRLNKMAD